MMKRFVPLLGVLVGAFLLTSCYMMSVRPTGTIKLNFGGTSNRAISSTATLRVYLYTYNSTGSYSLYTFPGGTAYKEFPYGNGSASISQVPIGLWQVLISAGSDGPNGSFLAAYYGASSVINVVAGTDTSASIQTGPSPVAYSADLAGKDLNGLYVGQSTGYVYASTTDMLYQGSIAVDTTVTPTVAGVPSPMPEVPQASQIAANGLQIHSIDGGYYYYSGSPATDPYINTNKGIVLYDMANGFDATFSQYLLDSSGNPYSVLKSAGVEQFLVTGANTLAVFYLRAQGLGGVNLTPTYTVPTISSGNAPWVDVSLPSSTTGQTVFDVVVNGDVTAAPVAYFATAGGAFRSDLTMIQFGSTASQNLGQYANYFSAPDGSTIKSMAILNGMLFIATTSGVYYGTLQETNLAQQPVSSWTKVNGVPNDTIQQIAPRVYYDAMQVPHLQLALRSAYNLYVFDATSNQVTTYPFYTGLPGELHSMAWFGSLLLVAGSQGLAGVQVAPVAPFSGL